jgi:NitT/TauT family transport system substrate-binding protein
MTAIGRILTAAATACALFGASQAMALDKVRVAAAQKGFWDTTIILFGIEKGFFKEQGIELDIVYTDGGADAQQAVISGSMDIAYSTGTLGVLSAWSKGAPIAVVSSASTGSSDLQFFVKKDSPIKSAKDLDGKSVAYSRPGSSSNLVAQKLVDGAGVKAKLVSTGGAAATLTAVMSGQVDVGWIIPPMHADKVDSGEIRVVFTGNQAPGVEKQTVRVHAANLPWLQKNPDLARRFLAANQKVIDWAHEGEEALGMWAAFHKLPVEQVRKVRMSAYPKSMMQMKTIGELDTTIQEAIESKRLDKPLTDAQKADFVKWVAQLNK